MGPTPDHAVGVGRIADGGWSVKHAKPRRLLYRQGYTPAELDQLVAEVGPEPLVAALVRWTALRSASPAE